MRLPIPVAALVLTLLLACEPPTEPSTETPTAPSAAEEPPTALEFTTVAAVSASVLAGHQVIPRANWKLKYADSQELVGENGAAVNAFDGNPQTIWHTQWVNGQPSPPHELQLNLGAVYELSGFRYLPRQDGGVNGRIGRYEFYVSADGVAWGVPVAIGSFLNSVAEKEVSFPPTRGQFIRLRALTEANGNPWTSLAELNALGRSVTTVSSTDIARTNWRLHYVDSQEVSQEDGSAINAFDGDINTFWHSQWSTARSEVPHEIQINLGAMYAVNGFRYLPRQDGDPNGRIGQYEFYVSGDGAAWGAAVAQGVLADSAAETSIAFAPKTGQFIRLRALSEINGNAWTSMAELNVQGVPSEGSAAQNFTRGAGPARKFGAHEIVLTGNGAVAAPFDTLATVTFTAPSGTIKTVYAFYDGGNTWRARVYVGEVGTWFWKSFSSSDALLSNRAGSFSATASTNPGMLKPHSVNKRQWMTDNGEDFINISETAYWLFDPTKTSWQQYIIDDIKQGVTSLRVDTFLDSAGNSWALIWKDAQKTQLNLAVLQVDDARIQWILNHYPGLHLQLKVLPGTEPYGADDDVWVSLPQSVRTSYLRNFVSRFAAYPNVFFEATNDVRANASATCTLSGRPCPNNLALAREVGNYFLLNDPWRHPMSHGPVSNAYNFFAGEPWLSYVSLQSIHRPSADDAAHPSYRPYHVFMTEDEYEQDGPGAPVSPNYYFRRLFWSWLLSGGSANYGGRVGGPPPFALVPYSVSGSLRWSKEGINYDFKRLQGLDSTPHISPYFKSRAIKLSQFIEDDGLATDLNGNIGEARAQVARRARDEFIVYHPNSTPGTAGRTATPHTSRAARFTLNLSNAPGAFGVEWFDPSTGKAQSGGDVAGGATLTFTAPWAADVILRLKRR